MVRITITLQDEEGEALRALAEAEKRDPRRQAAMVLRREFERLGLIKAGALSATQQIGGKQP